MEMTTGVLGTMMGDAQVEGHVLQLGLRAVLSRTAPSLSESPADVLSPRLAPLQTGIAIQEHLIAFPDTIPLLVNVGPAVLALQSGLEASPAVVLARKYQTLGSYQEVDLQRKTPLRGMMVEVLKAEERLLVPKMEVWAVNLDQRIRPREIMHPLMFLNLQGVVSKVVAAAGKLGISPVAQQDQTLVLLPRISGQAPPQWLPLPLPREFF